MAKKKPELALSVGVRSECGRRDDNQDKMSAFSTPLGMVYVVADGMGGYRGGAEASRRVVEGFQRHLNGSGFTDSINLREPFQRAAQQTNAEILAESSSGDPTVEGMGSTVVLALLRATPGGMQMLTAHIGDSRGYLLREGTLYRITRDHSMVQRMVDTGLLTAEQARNHPESNVLSRAIGKQPSVEIEVGDLFSMSPGDVLLLCSDGLWGPLTEQQIGEVLGRPTGTQEIADALVNLALECGSDDNITVQVVRYEYRGLGARSAAFFAEGSKSGAPVLPPPGVVAKYVVAPKPGMTSARRGILGKDLIFALLGALVVVALFIMGYQLLRSHRHSCPTPHEEVAPGLVTPAAKPSPTLPNHAGANGLQPSAKNEHRAGEPHAAPQQNTPQPNQNQNQQTPADQGAKHDDQSPNPPVNNTNPQPNTPHSPPPAPQPNPNGNGEPKQNH